ncbi:MAG TPA: polysaccharide deacetylase family protein [Vicinamibacterales bacterium]|jgi:peptidoglycan/xylan/chitin deacetylase (PgdA/CDA1 family)/folate-dependent phosphoribosylglycinamide formyltransferase PurN|nr:polysaccharide deacetylase family protein [Vicinamibacterales bacterium]
MSFRVVIIGRLYPASIWRLVDRLSRDAPGVVVAGVLLEPVQQKSLRARVTNFMRSARRPGYASYVAGRLLAVPIRAAARAGHAALHICHAAPRDLNSPELSTAELVDRLKTANVETFVTSRVHSPEAVAFVRSLGADLGILYGARILKPELFEIPRLGSINIHQRKVPDYRGGGPIGLWELLDDQQEIGVTIHRVTAALDAGAIVASATIPIEPFDDLVSLGLKADVVGDDLLVQAVRDVAAGTVRDRVQGEGGALYRTPAPEALRRMERTLRRRRPPFVPRHQWPRWKLMAHVVVFGVRAVWRNRRYRRSGSFPVVMLYHHVIADRPHTMGISTSHFARQVEYLRRHYRIASLPDAIAMLRAGRVDAPTVVLTFDDGYADNVLNVRAVLEPLGLSATFFVCSEHLTTGRAFQHDVAAGDDGFRPMTWGDARTLVRQGFTMASHTRTHFNCGSTDIERLRREIGDARTEIEAELGCPVPLFSFPWGQPANISADAVDVAHARYEAIFSACGGVNHPGADSGWHFRRCHHPDDLIELELTSQSLLDMDPAPLPF